MYDYDLSIVRQYLLNIEPTDRPKLVRYFAKLPEKIKIEVLKLQTDLIRQNRDMMKKNTQPEFFYSMFIKAIHYVKSIEIAHTQSIADEQEAVEKTKKITEIRIQRMLAEKAEKKKKTRDDKKFRLIKLRFYNEIVKMQKQGFTYKDISTYIAKYHKVKITPAYIQASMKKITKENYSDPT